MATGPTIEIRFKPPRVLYDRWRSEARALGLTIGQWLTLKTEGKLAAEGSRDAPVQPSKENDRPLWQRIDEAIRDGGFYQPLQPRHVPMLAKRLGVSRRAVEGSLGSMVASKRLIREGDVYRRVER